MQRPGGCSDRILCKRPMYKQIRLAFPLQGSALKALKKKNMCEGWHNLGPAANWRRSIGARSSSPFHACRIPLMDIPGLDRPEYIHPDTCHCFHIGWGKDLAASSIILLAKKRHWPGRSLDIRLEAAFADYISFLNARCKSTGVDGFSKQHFKMSSCLGLKGG